jgi:hypothetical protein
MLLNLYWRINTETEEPTVYIIPAAATIGLQAGCNYRAAARTTTIGLQLGLQL